MSTQARGNFFDAARGLFSVAVDYAESRSGGETQAREAIDMGDDDRAERNERLDASKGEQRRSPDEKQAGGLNVPQGVLWGAGGLVALGLVLWMAGGKRGRKR